MMIEQFDTDPFPLELRASSWSEALLAAGLAVDAGGQAPKGRSWGCDGTNGSRLTLIAADTGVFRRPTAGRTETLLLCAMLDGVARLCDGKRLNAGVIIRWADEPGTLLELSEPSRFLLLRLSLHDARAGAFGRGGGLTRLSTGMRVEEQKLLLSLMTTFAEALVAGADKLFMPLEAALSDILLTASTQSQGGRKDSATMRQQVMQAIERRLAEPHINLARFAAKEGLSERAVNKIFESEEHNFSKYLRHRRLLRAAEDLRDPTLSNIRIAEIGFRYGFHDPAHFSRAFRQSYGMPPATYRGLIETEILHEKAPPRSRGAPQPWAQLERMSPPEHEEIVPARGECSANYHLRATPKTIHWGYFSRALQPVLTVKSGDTVTVETITQHASDDAGRMIAGDADAEAIFRWTQVNKAVDRRGAGPFDASIYGRGAGEGFGVHILTGPIAVEGAQPGDILEVEILSITPRPSQAPDFVGRSFGSNAAVWWGYHYHELLTRPHPRETVTIYEVINCRNQLCAHAVYSFRWTAQTDPFGVIHSTIDYPGVPVDHKTIIKCETVLSNVHVPVRPHFGTIGLAPNYPGLLDSVPPSSFGGNIDNWRLGPGTRVFLPVSMSGGLLSLGDPHAAQGDGEVCGTAIECSMTGHLRLTLHKRESTSAMLRDLNYPLIETKDHWVVQGFSHPDYLADFGPSAQSDVYKRSSLDSAMRDTFRKARRFLMSAFGMDEDEAISLLSVAVDFGITQVVDGNLGAHACIPKSLFEPSAQPY
jgi:acetamidase/formamidase/AraC-like DNA-binding protein